MHHPRCLLIALAAVSHTVAQSPWMVGNEAQLRQALSAAAAGDRIELTASFGLLAPITIPTSVTLASAPGTRQAMGIANNGTGIVIGALHPTIPLVFDNLEITLSEFASSQQGITTTQATTGQVWFRNTLVQYGPFQPYEYGGVPMVRLEVDEVRLDGCRFEAFPMQRNFACIDLNGISGVSCLEFTGQRLSIQDSTLIAGDAIYLDMHPTGCFGGSGIQWNGGTGGTALRANAPLSVLTSSTFTDGAGTSFQAANWIQWGQNPIPGQPGASQFVGAGGVLIAHDVVHLPGAQGVIGSAPSTPPAQSIGNPNADFSITGSPTLGSTVTTSIPALGQGNAVLVIGVHWGPTPAVGSFLAPELATSLTVLIPQNSSQGWPIPNDPILRSLTIIAQVGYQDLGGAWQLTNPRTFWIR